MYYVYPKGVTTTAGTAVAIPLVTPWPMQDGTLVSVDLTIPAGHCGLTGIRIKQQFTEIVPWDTNAWVISNDEKITFPVDRQFHQGDITIETYNTDVFDHTFYLRATVLPLGSQPAATATAATAIPNNLLSGTIFG